jgi:hypothetical protein
MKWLIASALLFNSAAALLPGGVYENLNPINEKLRPPTAYIVAEESGGSLFGGAVCGLVAAMAAGYVASASRPANPDSSWWSMLRVGYPAALLGLPLGAATGVYVVGALERQGGAWWASTLGAYAGTAVAVGLAYLGCRSEQAGHRFLSIPLYILAGAAPLSGAVVGYNISTPCLSSRCYEQRFGFSIPGAVLGARAADPPQAGVRMQLLSLQI